MVQWPAPRPVAVPAPPLLAGAVTRVWHAVLLTVLRWRSLPVQTAQIRIGGSHMAPEDDVGLYGRSVTFIPESPSLPAPFR